MKIFETLNAYLAYDFVKYALVVGVLIALCSALFGVILVLKRFSFIGDGLSHVAFGAMAISAIVGVSDSALITLPITVIAAILLLRTGRNAKIKGDAAIAMVSVGALAIGYLLMSIFSKSGNVAGDVCSTLFGSSSIITLSRADVILCACLSALMIALFVLLYNKIFAASFDEDFARAIGLKTSAYNLLVAVITAVIIVLAMNLVGSLLISALVIFPALSAMRVCKSFRGVVICSAVLSATAAATGILMSILLSTPVGPTVVAVDILAFLIFSTVGKILKK